MTKDLWRALDCMIGAASQLSWEGMRPVWAGKEEQEVTGDRRELGFPCVPPKNTCRAMRGLSCARKERVESSSWVSWLSPVGCSSILHGCANQLHALPRESVDQGLFPGGRMDGYNSHFFLGRREDACQALHLSSGPQFSSTLAADIATGSSQGLVLAQCKLARKMCILRASGPAGCPLGVLSPAHPRVSSASSLPGNHLLR